MGTLQNQKPRDFREVSDRYLGEFLSEAVKMAKAQGIPVADVIAAKHALELERQNNLYAANGDTFDEQMAGLGDKLDELAAAIREHAAE